MKTPTLILSIFLSLIGQLSWALPAGSLVKLTQETTAYTPENEEKAIGKLPEGGQLKIVGEHETYWLLAKYKSRKLKKVMDVLILKSDLESAIVKLPDGSIIKKETPKEDVNAAQKPSSFTRHRSSPESLRLAAQTKEVTLEEMNNLFALPTLFLDDNLWDEPVEEISRRINWFPVSTGEFKQCYRLYPPEGTVSVGAKPYSQALYGENKMPSFISIIYANSYVISGEGAAAVIDHDFKTIDQRIRAVLGEPASVKIGKQQLTDKALKWVWGNHAFLLTKANGNYIQLFVLPPGAADHDCQGVFPRAHELAKLCKSRVKTNSIGDHLITEIPGNKRGPSGSIHSLDSERLLRYFNISVDFLCLDLRVRHVEGQPRIFKNLTELNEYIFRQYNFRYGDLKGDMSIPVIKATLDKGIPIMWRTHTTGEMIQALKTYNQHRKAAGDKWSAETKTNTKDVINIKFEENANTNWLVIGYNEKLNEIAFTTAHTGNTEPIWMPQENAEMISSQTVTPLKTVKF